MDKEIEREIDNKLEKADTVHAIRHSHSSRQYIYTGYVQDTNILTLKPMLNERYVY